HAHPLLHGAALVLQPRLFAWLPDRAARALLRVGAPAAAAHRFDRAELVGAGAARARQLDAGGGPAGRRADEHARLVRADADGARAPSVRPPRVPHPAVPAQLPVPDGAAAPIPRERGGVPPAAGGRRLGGEPALLPAHPGAARRQHHPPAQHDALRRGGVPLTPLADAADHARRGVRVLLPQDRGRARGDRALRGPDRHRGELAARSADGNPRLSAGREGGGGPGARVPGTHHLRSGVPAAAGRSPAAGPHLARSLAAARAGPQLEDDGMTKSIIALAFLMLNFYIYHWFASDEVIPSREPFAHFPLQLGDWTCPQRITMDEPTLKNLGASDYLICDYQRANPASTVGVYLGYHETQIRTAGGGSVDANPIHPPKHCLPGSGWDIIAES